MATHSSILAWKISWTEEPRGFTVSRTAKSRTQVSKQMHTNILHTYMHTCKYVIILLQELPTVVTTVCIRH